MRFSVIMPIYNKIDTIKAALESVYSQTFDDFEIVLIVDGSPRIFKLGELLPNGFKL
jgi:glycosyltransferase involved in cell wall biosynthesis